MEGEQKTVRRYFWLKLKEEFFQDKEIKKLRRIAGGDTYTIIYLKLMLISLKTDGRLYFDKIEDTFYEELALEIDEDADNVRVTLMYLEKMGLIQIISDEELLLTQMNNLICSESQSAQRVRDHRARKKAIESANEQHKLPENSIDSIDEDIPFNNEMLQCNTDVTECNVEETTCNTYTYTDTYTDIYTDTNTKKETQTKMRKKSTPFVPPTEGEVEAYCKERGNGIIAAEFVDFYASKGWMIGKNKMKDWKACVRTWERKRGFSYTGPISKEQHNRQLERILQ